MDLQYLKPILAVHFAEMEIAHDTEVSKKNALYLLYHLAVGGIYKDLKTRPQGMDYDLTSAKRIYQERIVQAVSNQSETFDAHLMSWVIAGALFEELVNPDKVAGKLVSANTLRNVLESIPENVRTQNCFLEIIQKRYLSSFKMLPTTTLIALQAKSKSLLLCCS